MHHENTPVRPSVLKSPNPAQQAKSLMTIGLYFN